jgi:lysozyme
MNPKTKTILIVASIALILTLSTMTSSAAEIIIKKFEAGDGINKYLKAYLDPVGIWTIGYGSIYNYDKQRRVIQGDVIDEPTALKWMREENINNIPKIKNLVKVPINQNQLDSLTSFVYNIGIPRFAASTMLRKLNSGYPKEIVAAEFDKWNKGNVNGELIVLNGLVARRKLEKELFLKV